MATFQVGRVTVPVELAVKWVTDYTSPPPQDTSTTRTAIQRFAYPAYDRLLTGSGPNELNDGDLLAPLLLNAAPSVNAFYRFQAMKAGLEQGLRRCANRPLAELPDEVIERDAHALYGVLDEDRSNHGKQGQGGTTLSKILHRKRPESLSLHDKWVHRCYVGDGAPVAKATSRSWAEYMTLLTTAMKRDLLDQQDLFTRLRDAVQGTTSLTDLRLLDILAWSSRGKDPVP